MAITSDMLSRDSAVSLHTHRPREESPSLMGGWRLLRPLARSTFFDLFLAAPATCDPDWPADYVLKLARGNNDHRLMGARLLRREAEVSRCVAHPHLATVLDEQSAHQPPFIVQPFYDGQTWQEQISQRPGCVATAAWTARQVAEALQALHENGWIHADVKPTNVLISPLGHATLIDLGAARRLNEQRRVVAENHLELTPGYAAPEWYMSELYVTAAADVYSLGVCLYEALSGQKLFPYQNPRELIAAHRSEVPPNLRQKNAAIPIETAQLVHRMLAKDPTSRPSLDAVIEQLVRTEIAFFTESVSA